MIARRFIAGVVLGISLGSVGTYLFLTMPLTSGIFEMEGIPAFNKTEDTTEFQYPSVINNNLRYDVVDVRSSDYGINGETPLDGGFFLIVKVEIENLGKNEVLVFGKNWFLKDSQGRVYLPKTHNAKNVDTDDLFSIRIPPGFKVVRDVGFEVPSYLDERFELYVPDKPFDSDHVLLGKIA